MIEAPGIVREPQPGNVPPYNITLRPAQSQGYKCSTLAHSTTIAGSAVGWAEFFLQDGLTARDSNDIAAQEAEQRLRAIASDTQQVSDKRIAASAVLQWALTWRQCIYGVAGPAPAPVVAPGVVAVGPGAVTSTADVQTLLQAAGVPSSLRAAAPVPGSSTFLEAQRAWDANLKAPGVSASSGSGTVGAGLQTTAGTAISGWLASLSAALGLTLQQTKLAVGLGGAALLGLVWLKSRRRRR